MLHCGNLFGYRKQNEKLNNIFYITISDCEWVLWVWAANSKSNEREKSRTNGKKRQWKSKRKRDDVYKTKEEKKKTTSK